MCVDRGRVAYLGTTVTGELVKDVAVRLAVIVQVLPDQVDQVVYSVGVRPRLRERGGQRLCARIRGRYVG